MNEIFPAALVERIALARNVAVAVVEDPDRAVPLARESASAAVLC